MQDPAVVVHIDSEAPSDEARSQLALVLSDAARIRALEARNADLAATISKLNLKLEGAHESTEVSRIQSEKDARANKLLQAKLTRVERELASERATRQDTARKLEAAESQVQTINGHLIQARQFLSASVRVNARKDVKLAEVSSTLQSARELIQLYVEVEVLERRAEKEKAGLVVEEAGVDAEISALPTSISEPALVHHSQEHEHPVPDAPALQSDIVAASVTANDDNTHLRDLLRDLQATAPPLPPVESVVPDSHPSVVLDVAVVTAANAELRSLLGIKPFAPPSPSTPIPAASSPEVLNDVESVQLQGIYASRHAPRFGPPPIPISTSVALNDVQPVQPQGVYASRHAPRPGPAPAPAPAPASPSSSPRSPTVTTPVQKAMRKIRGGRSSRSKMAHSTSAPQSSPSSSRSIAGHLPDSGGAPVPCQGSPSIAARHRRRKVLEEIGNVTTNA